MRECLEEVGGIFEGGMFFVAVGEDGLGWCDAPIDGEGGVVPEDAAFMWGGIVIGDFVDDLGVGLEGEEAVGEADGDEDLAPVFGAEDGGNVSAEGGGIFADVECDVEDRAVDDADELMLGHGGKLAMQAADDSFFDGEGVVVLDELGVDSGIFEESLVEGLGEESAMVAEFFRDEDLHVGDFAGDDLHGKYCLHAVSAIDSVGLGKSRGAMSWAHRKTQGLPIPGLGAVVRPGGFAWLDDFFDGGPAGNGFYAEFAHDHDGGDDDQSCDEGVFEGFSASFITQDSTDQ